MIFSFGSLTFSFLFISSFLQVSGCRTSGFMTELDSYDASEADFDFERKSSLSGGGGGSGVPGVVVSGGKGAEVFYLFCSILFIFFHVLFTFYLSLTFYLSFTSHLSHQKIERKQNTKICLRKHQSYSWDMLGCVLWVV